MKIELVEHDPTWKVLADDARLQLLTTLPGLFEAIEHIGSTAVPGLAAKPVIDLMASARDLDAVVEHDTTFDGLGYERQANGMTGRLFYYRPGYHLHVVTADTWETRNERLLRDHLISHPKAAAEYAALKLQLVGETDDLLVYTRAKTALVQRLVDHERTFRRLPLVPVWED